MIEQAEQSAFDGHAQLPDDVRDRLADLVEALRVRVVRKPKRDPRSLFDLDERLIDLMDRVEEEVLGSGATPEEPGAEINAYLEAFRLKVDRIAGYWRWQESIARIRAEEVERLTAHKRVAEAHVTRLKNMLLAFMMSRELKKLGGEKASIGMQPNSAASLVIDDSAATRDCFFETRIRFTKTGLQELVYRLPDGELRRRLEAALKDDGWEINTAAAKAALINNSRVAGARLVRGITSG